MPIRTNFEIEEDSESAFNARIIDRVSYKSFCTGLSILHRFFIPGPGIYDPNATTRLADDLAIVKIEGKGGYARFHEFSECVQFPVLERYTSIHVRATLFSKLSNRTSIGERIAYFSRARCGEFRVFRIPVSGLRIARPFKHRKFIFRVESRIRSRRLPPRVPRKRISGGETSGPTVLPV